MRRNYTSEAIEIILSLMVIVCSIALFFKAGELTVLYPAVFGLASLMCFVYAFEGVMFRKNRVVRKSRGALFVSAGVLLAVLTWFSAKVVL